MPAGSQSLQSYAPTINTTQSATLYKANLDSNSSILGNPAASFYVYPTQPASMTVNIDKGFTYLQTGTGMVLNNGGVPTTVSLVAPGSNSYYGTVYYDSVAGTFGVIYGVSGASPFPILPDYLHQLPLAFVLLTSVTTTIQATNITDCRHALLSSAPFQIGAGTISASTPYECFGATKLYWMGNISASVTVTFNHVRIGARVTLDVFNSAGVAETFKIAATLPDGTAYAVTACNTGGVGTNMVSTGVAIGAGLVFVFDLETVGGPVMQGTVIG